jgi:hypothetical protein
MRARRVMTRHTPLGPRRLFPYSIWPTRSHCSQAYARASDTPSRPRSAPKAATSVRVEASAPPRRRSPRTSPSRSLGTDPLQINHKGGPYTRSDPNLLDTRAIKLVVLKRQVPRPRFEPDDRAILAACARVLDHDRWSSLLVKPDDPGLASTTRRQPLDLPPPPGPASHAIEIRQTIIRLARENPTWGTAASTENSPASASPSPHQPCGQPEAGRY